MKVAIPTEIKNHEYRVAITPAGVHELVNADQEVYIQTGAGLGSSITDEEYVHAGATMIDDPDELWGLADMVMKVKEPIAEEYPRLKEGLILYTYLHLAADRPLTDELMKRGVVGIAYETVTKPDGSLPLLAPMSEVAGRLAPQVGAYALMKAQGGRGILPGGIPGVRPAKTVIIGTGVAGMNAAVIALGMQADVVLIDTNMNRLRELDGIYRGLVKTMAASQYAIEQEIVDADMVIGAVLIPGAKAPKVVTNEMVATMKPGSVLVDISVDQGGCFEDTRPTTHADPTFTVHDSVFYCVANMPGAVPRTSTFGLTNVTMSGAVSLARRGWREAMRRDTSLSLGLNTVEGQVVNEPVAQAHGLSVIDLREVVSS